MAIYTISPDGTGADYAWNNLTSWNSHRSALGDGDTLHFLPGTYAAQLDNREWGSDTLDEHFYYTSDQKIQLQVTYLGYTLVNREVTFDKVGLSCSSTFWYNSGAVLTATFKNADYSSSGGWYSGAHIVKGIENCTFTGSSLRFDCIAGITISGSVFDSSAGSYTTLSATNDKIIKGCQFIGSSASRYAATLGGSGLTVVSCGFYATGSSGTYIYAGTADCSDCVFHQETAGQIGAGTFTRCFINTNPTVLPAGVTVGAPLFIDPVNGNLNLLPNSPAITSGGGELSYEDGDATVSWADFNHTGGSDLGTFAHPFESRTSFEAAYNAGSFTNNTCVFKAGTHTWTGGTPSWTYSGGAQILIIGQDPNNRPVLTTAGPICISVKTNTQRITFQNLEFLDWGGTNIWAITCFNVEQFITFRNVRCFPKNNTQATGLCGSQSGGQANLTVRGVEGIYREETFSTVIRFFWSGTDLDINGLSISLNRDTEARLPTTYKRGYGSFSGDHAVFNYVSDMTQQADIPVTGTSGNNILPTGSIITNLNATLVDNPLFIDPTNNNLNLLPNSPAITSGSGVGGDVYTGETADTWFDPTKTGATSTGADPANAFGRDELAALQTAIQTVGDGCIVGVKDGTMPVTSITWTSNVSGMDVRFVAQTKYGVVFDSLNSAQFWQLDTSVGKTTSLEGFKIQNSRIVSFTGAVFNDRNVSGCTTLYKDWIAVNVSTLNYSIGLFGTTSAASTIILENVSIYADNATGGMFSYQYSGNPTIILRRCNIVWRSKLSYDLQIEQSNLVNEGVSVLATTVTPTVDSISNIINFSTQSQGSSPLFIDLVNGNFNLLPNSPAITAGV